MMILLTIIAFIFVLGILIMVHEFGHFIAAKKSGVKVEEFAFGFPPRIYSFKKGETNYSINLFPIGGYVKMLGELEESKSPRAFENQTVGKRFAISIAGVVMNFLLAWVIFTIGFAVGMAPIVSPPNEIPGKVIKSEIIVADIGDGSPAQKMGLQKNDLLISGSVANNGTVVFATANDVHNFTLAHLGQEVALKYEHDNVISEKTVTISNDKNSPLGVAIVEHSVVRTPWYRAPWIALRETGRVVKVTFSFLGSVVTGLFKTHKLSEGVGGPVAVYVYTGLAVQAGLMVFLQFIALLSINLGLINILPFPALDGGRLLFIIIEKFLGRKVVHEQVENIIHTVGFGLLLVLIALISYRDVMTYIFHR